MMEVEMLCDIFLHVIFIFFTHPPYHQKINILVRLYFYERKRNVIYIDGKPVLKGRNLKKLVKMAKEKYPEKISIGWEMPEGVLIA